MANTMTEKIEEVAAPLPTQDEVQEQHGDKIELSHTRKLSILIVMNTVSLVQSFDATCICVVLPVGLPLPPCCEATTNTDPVTCKRAGCILFRKPEHGLRVLVSNSHSPAHLCRNGTCRRQKASICGIPHRIYRRNGALRLCGKQHNASYRSSCARSRVRRASGIVGYNPRRYVHDP